MATDANARANLRTAAGNVRAQLGLSDTPSDWTYDQRIQYNSVLAAYIQNLPAASFTPDIIQIAQGVQASTEEAQALGPLADTSFDWGEFADDAAANAGSIVSGLPSFLTPLLIVAIVAVAAFYILPGALAKAKAAA